jgi:hypothetical protein
MDESYKMDEMFGWKLNINEIFEWYMEVDFFLDEIIPK